MSALGAARCPNLAGREGVVIGTGRYPSTVRVMFDGFRSATSLHHTYIEPVAGKKALPARTAASFDRISREFRSAKQLRVQERSCLPNVCQ